MPDTEFKPCPFCGSKHVSIESVFTETGNFEVLGCDTCRAEGPLGNNQAKAIKLWNKREEG
jgi:Lar family restriction alleviation protein